ncbi:hypothetical protein GCM10027600_43210 [Nocardioides ginsengisegetis]
MTPLDVLDVHMTRLFGWFVQTLGRALLVGAVCAGVPALLGAGGYSLAVGAAGFAIYLMTASAPMPIEVDETD